MLYTHKASMYTHVYTPALLVRPLSRDCVEDPGNGTSLFVQLLPLIWPRTGSGLVHSLPFSVPRARRLCTVGYKQLGLGSSTPLFAIL